MGLGNLRKKLESFGWHVSSCDGHSIPELLEAFQGTAKGRPHGIIAETVKGKGVSFIENRPEWHHHRLSREEYEQARHSPQWHMGQDIAMALDGSAGYSHQAVPHHLCISIFASLHSAQTSQLLFLSHLSLT